MPTYGKENFKESNVNYLNKDFASLKTSLMDYAKSYFPNTYKDFNETSPGMMLLEMNAYVGDVLSFYVDQQYREMLLPLAEERRSIINMANMFGYKVKPIVPSYVDLTFKQDLDANANDTSKINYKTGLIVAKGVQVKGTDNNITFTTLEPIDFQITSSADTSVISSFNDTTGLASTYTLERTVRAVSGKSKSSTFTIGAPEKFKKITIPDTNVIDILSVRDTNGNLWYEVDFLAQDKVPISTHYTNDEFRQSAYHSSLSGETDTLAVPYSLTYIKTSKRFTRETNENGTTSLIFGNGVLKDGNLVDGDYIDLEQVGIVVPGQANDLNEAINPLLGDEYSTLGETPNNTKLTVTYRVGGGVGANVPVGDLTVIKSGNPSNGSAAGKGISDLTVTNTVAARGGKDEESIDEIREKAKAFFSTQNRCVTKEDYEARLLNIPARYGNIAKVFVVRSGDDGGNDVPQTHIDNIATLNSSITEAEFQLGEMEDYIQSLEEVQGGVASGGMIAVSAPLFLSHLMNIRNAMNTVKDSVSPLAGYSDFTMFDMSTIKAYILSYDNNKNLVGNPNANLTTSILPATLLENIKNYLSNFRILTDSVELMDGFIVNFGVMFDVVAEKYANKQKVKLKCIDTIKKYFHVDKMQFNQPIYVSQLEHELMAVEGVRSIGHVTVTQEEDYFYPTPTLNQKLGAGTWTYSWDSESSEYKADGDTPDYGYMYNFEDALDNGVIRPPLSSGAYATPAVFELKKPNQNIQGRVR